MKTRFLFIKHVFRLKSSKSSKKMAKTTATLDSRSSKAPAPLPAISYKLSDKYFLDIGWTAKPNIPSTLPVVVMKAKFSHSAISPWFQQRLTSLKLKYPNGDVLCTANVDGTGEIYYPNNKLAIKIEKGGINNQRTRVWVYSSGEVDMGGVRLSSNLCALFDSLGNGVVYDGQMKKRLVYNQKEGMLMDSPSGIPVTWKWHNIPFLGSINSMNEEDDKRKLIVEPPKRIISAPLPDIKANEKESEKTKRNATRSPSLLSMKLTQSEIDFRETFEHSRYLDTARVKPKSVSPVKPIVLRLNRYMALRIFSQSEISLTFFTTTHQTTLQIGVLYNPYDKLKVVEIDNSSPVQRVICPFEDFPPNTKSMLDFRKMLQAYGYS